MKPPKEVRLWRTPESRTNVAGETVMYKKFRYLITEVVPGRLVVMQLIERRPLVRQ